MICDRAELVVIGGGPAGMMCAFTAAERGVDTVLSRTASLDASCA